MQVYFFSLEVIKIRIYKILINVEENEIDTAKEDLFVAIKIGNIVFLQSDNDILTETERNIMEYIISLLSHYKLLNVNLLDFTNEMNNILKHFSNGEKFDAKTDRIVSWTVRQKINELMKDN